MDGNQDDDHEEDEDSDEGAAAPSSLPAPALITGAAVTNFTWVALRRGSPRAV